LSAGEAVVLLQFGVDGFVAVNLGFARHRGIVADFVYAAWKSKSPLSQKAREVGHPDNDDFVFIVGRGILYTYRFREMRLVLIGVVR
jgi:hypothetical protein